MQDSESQFFGASMWILCASISSETEFAGMGGGGGRQQHGASAAIVAVAAASRRRGNTNAACSVEAGAIATRFATAPRKTICIPIPTIPG